MKQKYYVALTGQERRMVIEQLKVTNSMDLIYSQGQLLNEKIG